jgi:hypothetical protein
MNPKFTAMRTFERTSVSRVMASAV